MHGSITLGHLTIAGADVPPAKYETGQGFRLFLASDDPAQTERWFEALAHNATIEMPLQQTFWSVRFGLLRDQFGIPWTLSCAQSPDS